MEHDTTIFRRHLIMSTHCNIHIYDGRDDSSLWIYRHFDGYPENTGKELKEFLSSENNRVLSPNDILDGLIYMFGDSYEKTEHQHGDISYLYEIEINETITVLKINKMSYIYDDVNWYSGFKSKIEETEKIEYINDISLKNNSEYIKQTPWKISELKKMYARINYIDILDLMDSGILDNVSDTMEVDESIIREKIICALLKEFKKNVSIELVEKTYKKQYEKFYKN